MFLCAADHWASTTLALFLVLEYFHLNIFEDCGLGQGRVTLKKSGSGRPSAELIHA